MQTEQTLQVMEETFSKIDEDSRWWIGGILDGDGCINWQSTRAGSGRLSIAVGQAENGVAMLHHLKSLLGGTIYKLSLPKKGTHQQGYQWTLAGFPARQLAEHIAKYTVLKRPQYEVAAAMPPTSSRFVSITATKGNQVLTFGTRKECQKHFGIGEQRLLSKIKGSTRRADTRDLLPGWTFSETRLDPAKTKLTQQEGDAQLRRLKKEPHTPISSNDMPPIAWIAGMVDSDGHIGMRHLAIGQKYSAATAHLKARLGGSITHSQAKPDYHVWRLYDSRYYEFLSQLASHLVNKAPQASLLLSHLTTPQADTQNKLRAMQGRQLQV